MSDVRFADRAVNGSDSPTCRRGGPEQLLTYAGGNTVVVAHVAAGGMSCLVNGRVADLDAGSLYVFWAATPCKPLRVRDGTCASFLTLPFTRLFDWSLPPDFVRRLLDGHVVGRITSAAQDERLFERWERDLASQGDRNIDATLLEIRARLVRFALGTQSDVPGAAPPAYASSTVERLATYAAAHYAERLSANAMSEQLHVRPGYAMALFRKSFGMSLGRYMAHHRIAHAVRLLATTDLPARDVAQAAGFATLRRMTRAFRRALSCSPAEFRRRHRLAPITGAVP